VIFSEHIEAEISALRDLTKTIDSGTLNEAIWMLAINHGIVCLGVGKCAVMAERLAASLRSIGIKAVTLSTQDLMHGDLGFIGDQDVVAISRSGETLELQSALHAIRRIHEQQDWGAFAPARILAITMAGSSVAKLAHCVLPIAAEDGLLPGAFLTAVTALSNALIQGVMEIRNLSPEQLALIHPGGTIGQTLRAT